jgi:hypothetical protein
MSPPDPNTGLLVRFHEFGHAQIAESNGKLISLRKMAPEEDKVTQI